MSTGHRLKRRSFVKICASLIAAASASPRLFARGSGAHQPYDRVQLVDRVNRPLRASALSVGESYIFNYPYICTPCFLLNLGSPAARVPALTTEDGRGYSWQGGVGPARSLVAFSAICAHKMTHPARSVSFINYRHDTVRFTDLDEETTERPQVIFCCSEKSVYDPTQGGQVLGGPAPQPLAAISLDYDEQDDALYATGIHGGQMFERFFAEFRQRLQLEYRTSDVERRVTQTTTIQTMAEYTTNQVLC